MSHDRCCLFVGHLLLYVSACQLIFLSFGLLLFLTIAFLALLFAIAFLALLFAIAFLALLFAFAFLALLLTFALFALLLALLFTFSLLAFFLAGFFVVNFCACVFFSLWARGGAARTLCHHVDGKNCHYG